MLSFINAGNRKETLASLWDSLALKFLWLGRPTERGGGAGDTSPRPPNLFREKGPHGAFKLYLSELHYLFLSLSIGLSGLNE